MASPFPSASIELEYPLYSLGFDPEDPHRLAVGGGGGAGRSGVGNKITVLDTVEKDELQVAGQIDLSRDEDSVMSLAIGATDGTTTYLYAGINSGPEQIAKGKNQHLRTLTIEQTKARAAAGAANTEVQVTHLSRDTFFKNPDVDTYQRLLRVVSGIGAAATGMGKEPQLAIFDAAGAKAKVRNLLKLDKDAEDLDIIQNEKGEHLVAFIHNYELHLIKVGAEKAEPELVFTMPDDHGERPSFRNIRFLTPSFILAVANIPRKRGAIIQGLRLPNPGQEKARIAISARIPGNISATALAVANVSPPASAETPIGDTQFAIAVACNDSSIALYTIEHKKLASIEVIAELYSLHTLKDIHGNVNITGLAFSSCAPLKGSVRPHLLRLASISLQKSVAVHSIPLKKRIEKSTTAKDGSAAAATERYVIAKKSKPPGHSQLLITLSIMVLIMAIVGQGVLEIVGVNKPILQAHKLISWQRTLRTPDHVPEFFDVNHLVTKLGYKDIHELNEDGTATIVMEAIPHLAGGEGEEAGREENADGTSAKIKLNVHDEELHKDAKPWEELSESQRKAWQQHLHEAGAWTQNMGGSVFKGILFGELAGAVGHALAN